MDADAWVFHESDCANPDTANTNNVAFDYYEEQADSYFCTGNTLVDGGGGARSMGTTPLSGIIQSIGMTATMQTSASSAARFECNTCNLLHHA